MLFKSFVIYFCFIYYLFCCKILWSVADEATPEDSWDKVHLIVVSGSHQITPDEHLMPKYVVSIRKQNILEFFGDNHICGGSILTETLILTAAHCLYHPKKGTTKPEDLTVVAGSVWRLKVTNTTQILKAEEVIVHRRYRSRKHIYDIGLIRLKDRIRIDDNTTGKIALPNTEPPYGTSCVALGWGRLYNNGPLPNQILHVDIEILTQQQCEIRLPLFGKGVLCAADIFDSSKGTCRGDSGGPLICKGTVTGIVSYGFGCGLGIPDAYTDVYYYKKWIEQNSAQRNYITKQIHYLLPIILLIVII